MAVSIKALKEQLNQEKREQVSFADSFADKKMEETDVVVFDARQANIKDLESQIQTAERIEAAKALEIKEEHKVSFVGTKPTTQKEYDLAFAYWGLSNVKGGNQDITPEMKAAGQKLGIDIARDRIVSFDQDVGTAADGGNLLNGEDALKVIERLKNYGNMLNVATVLYSPNADPYFVVMNDDTGNTASLVANEVSSSNEVSNTNLAFDPKYNLLGYDYASGVFEIGRQILKRAPFDLVSFAGRACSTRIARKVNDAWTNGTGSNQPQGLANGLASGQTNQVASLTDFSFTDFLATEDKLDPDYRGRAKVMMHSRTWSYIRANWTSQIGTYLYQNESLALGGPKTLAGYEIAFNNSMPYIGSNGGTGNEVVLLVGDFEEAFIVRICGQLEVVLSREQYWKSQGLAVASWLTTDSKVQNPFAYAGLKMKDNS